MFLKACAKYLEENQSHTGSTVIQPTSVLFLMPLPIWTLRSNLWQVVEKLVPQLQPPGVSQHLLSQRTTTLHIFLKSVEELTESLLISQLIQKYYNIWSCTSSKAHLDNYHYLLVIDYTGDSHTSCVSLSIFGSRLNLNEVVCFQVVNNALCFPSVCCGDLIGHVTSLASLYISVIP